MRSYLIVDDNKDLAENLAEIIRDRGDEAVVVGSGPEALALIGHGRFDAMLTDMRMPAMDGAELVRRVRQEDPGVPAIVITAFFKDAGIRAAQAEGPLAVLPKPVPVPQLLHLLDVARRDARIVLVEDDPVLSDNLTELLQDRGFSVSQLRSGEQIESLPPDRPLLAIVDLRLPGAADGDAVGRVSARFPGLPILVATAHRDIPVSVDAERLFLKPFSTADLVATIEAVYRGAGEGARP
jgi:CheY-like chemotaxis protein